MKKGCIISFWSKAGHHNGVTTNLIIFAKHFSELFKEKNILILDTNYKFALLHKYINAIHNRTLDYLLNKNLVNELNKKTFCESLIIVSNVKENNIYNINPSSNFIYNNIQDYKFGLDKIIDIAQEIFDFIFIDNGAGNNEVSMFINSKANVVVNFLNQNKYILDYLKETNGLVELRDKIKFINIVNNYNENKGITLKDIKKIYKLENIDYIPVNEKIDLVLNEGKIINLLERSKELEYNKQIEIISEKIIKMLKIEIEDRVKKKTKRIIFKLFRQ